MVEEHVVEKILNNCAAAILSKMKNDGLRFKSGTDFEDFVHDTLLKIVGGFGVNPKYVMHSGPQTFPDIVIETYGVEIKLCQRDEWTSTGNSIKETTKIKGLSKIFIFFLKQGGEPEIKFGEYKDFMSDVVVTHSPRYLIDMNLDGKDTIFAKIGVEYEKFSGDEAIQKIKEHYAAEGKNLWWVGKAMKEDSKDGTTSRAYLNDYAKLKPEQKDSFIIESLIYFPELFSASQTKYKAAGIYLIENYDAISTNLRDIFSAGGKVVIEAVSEDEELPRVYQTLYDYAKQIHERFPTIKKSDVEFYWDVTIKNGEEIEKVWISLIIDAAKDETVEVVYKEGCRR